MEWIHCNKCYCQPKMCERSFALTDCGHIFCDVCNKRAESGKEFCHLCSTACHTIPLSSNLPSDVKMYLQSPTDMLKKALKVFEFQKSHRLRLAKYRTSLTDQYQNSRKEIGTYIAEIKYSREIQSNMNEEIQKLRTELEEKTKQLTQAERVLRSPAFHSPYFAPDSGPNPPHSSKRQRKDSPFNVTHKTDGFCTNASTPTFQQLRTPGIWNTSTPLSQRPSSTVRGPTTFASLFKSNSGERK